MQAQFTLRNVKLPDKAKSKNYVPNAITFLKSIGPDGFAEAERLQDIDVESLTSSINKVKETHSMHGVKLVRVIVLASVLPCLSRMVTFHVVFC